MKNCIPFFTIIILISLVLGCTPEAQRSLQPVPTAFGKLNQIVIVADERIWEGPVGDSLRYYFEAPYLMLPQPEPIYDLLFFTPKQIFAEISRRELRHYFIVGNLNEKDSPTSKLILKDIGSEKARRAKEDIKYSTTVGKDKWARGQQVIYQFAYSDDDLITGIRRNFPLINQKIQASEEDKIKSTVFQAGENVELQQEIQETLGVNMKIPNDYFMAIAEDSTMWLRKETDDISSNIFIKKIDYSNEAQLSKEYSKAIRDTIGRKFVSTEIEDTYMQVNDQDLPIVSNVKKVNGYYTIESRGIWEIVNDYMGGPYISYLLHDPETGRLVFLDGFVYAPSKDKRNYMQHLEFILNTVSF